jgi:hypothetical protein
VVSSYCVEVPAVLEESMVVVLVEEVLAVETLDIGYTQLV